MTNEEANAIEQAYLEGYEDAKKKYARPKGEWERVGLFYDRNVIDCPFCGDTFCRKDIPNFCENCGADLRGSENEA